jgi:hypothetical protein
MSGLEGMPKRSTIAVRGHERQGRFAVTLEFVFGTHRAKLVGHNRASVPCPRGGRGQGTQGARLWPESPMFLPDCQRVIMSRRAGTP